MTFLIIMFGALMLLIGIIVIVNPGIVFDLLHKNRDKLWLYTTAVLARLLLGTLLIYQAGMSKHPHAIEIIGWIIVIAAIAFLVIGRERFVKLIAWAETLIKSSGRVAGILAVGFGAFLIHSFV